MSEKELEAAKSEEVQMTVVYPEHPEHEEAELLKTSPRNPDPAPPAPGTSYEGMLSLEI